MDSANKGAIGMLSEEIETRIKEGQEEHRHKRTGYDYWHLANRVHVGVLAINLPTGHILSDGTTVTLKAEIAIIPNPGEIVFNLKIENDQFGNGYYSGCEPHPKKSIGFILVQKNGKISLSVVKVKPEIKENRKYSNYDRHYLSTEYEANVQFGDIKGAIAYGLLVQGRDDWQGTEFTATDNQCHPEDETWDKVIWDNQKVYPEHWNQDLPVLSVGDYPDDMMARMPFLKEIFGLTKKDFPRNWQGPKIVEFPELNYFDRISGNGTVMWAIPKLTLHSNGKFEIGHREDAVTRIRTELKELGLKTNRDRKGREIRSKIEEECP